MRPAMRATIRVLLSALVASACQTLNPSAGQPDVTEVTDKVRGSDQFETKDMHLGGGLHLVAVHGARDTTNSVVFLFKSYTSDWRFLMSQDLAILVDDSVRIRPRGDSVTRVGRVSAPSGGIGPRVTELMVAILTVPDFHRLAYAQTAVGALGPADFTFSPSQLATLRALDEKITPSPQNAGADGERPVPPRE